MSQFDTLIPYIFHYEGVGIDPKNPTGLVELPGDPGGLTNWGISQKEYSQIIMKPGFGDLPQSVKDLTKEQASYIYKVEYYLSEFDNLPLAPALVVFDCEVNQGLGIKILQRAIGATDDGKWGPESEGQLRGALRNEPGLVEDLLWLRIASYVSISKSSTINQRFLATLWLPRLAHVRKDAKLIR